MADQFAGTLDSVSSPATRGVAVVPSDGAALSEVPKALYVGTSGDLVVRGAGGGADVRFANVPDGTVIPFRAAFVRATGTSAGDILALY